MTKRIFSAIVLIAALSLSACRDNSNNKEKTENNYQKAAAENGSHSTVSDLNEIDVFENCRIVVFDDYDSCYPNNMCFVFSTMKSEYRDKIDYNCTVTGNCSKIIAEATVNAEKYAEEFKKEGLKIKNNTTTLEFDLSETKTQLLYKEQLNDEVINAIDKKVSSKYIDGRTVTKMYALIPKKDTVFFENIQCSEYKDGLYANPKEGKKLPEYQIFAFLPYDNEHTEIYECNVQFKGGKLLDSNPFNVHREESEDGQNESVFANSEADAIFDRMVSDLRDNYCDFDVVEIPMFQK